MVESFELQSVHGLTRLEFLGQLPRGLEGYDGCSFIAKLQGPPVDASIEVYDIQPQRWGEYFRSLAARWKGWPEELAIESLEGHLRLACTSDGAGHIVCRVRLRGMYAEDDWIAEVNLHLEAGQLESLARAAVAYFGAQHAGAR